MTDRQPVPQQALDARFVISMFPGDDGHALVERGRVYLHLPEDQRPEPVCIRVKGERERIWLGAKLFNDYRIRGIHEDVLRLAAGHFGQTVKPLKAGWLTAKIDAIALACNFTNETMTRHLNRHLGFAAWSPDTMIAVNVRW